MQNLKRIFSTESIAYFILFFGHLIAAYTSYGYHHPDEHFQIWEWANTLLGLSPDASRLPWEHAAQIRPWFQPMLHAAFMKPMIALGIYDPFSTAFLMRALYGLLNVFALSKLWTYFKKNYDLNPLWILWISILWFLPYIHVRTSSENLAGIFLSFALLALLDRKQFFKSGILFGFAFLARYQIALGLAGLGLALLIHERKITRSHLIMLLGFLIPVGLGVVLDRIGYGNWVLSSYRYFKVNLVDGVAAQYSPKPWYQYFNWLFQLNPLISVPLFFGAVQFLKKGKTEDRLILGSFVWAFFVLHCMITNKEYRFLFPVLNFIPFMTAVSFKSFEKNLNSKPLFASYVMLNFFSFSVSTLHGASLLTTGAPHLAHQHLKLDRPSIANRDFTHQLPYYSFPEHPVHLFKTSDELRQILPQHPRAQVLIDSKWTEPDTQIDLQILKERGCIQTAAVIPHSVSVASERYPFLRNLPFIVWYDCP